MNMLKKCTYSPPPVSEREILRYAGCAAADKGIKKLLEAAVSEAEEHLIYRVCYREISVATNADICDLSFVRLESKTLANTLKDCKQAVIFAATVGIALDRLIAKYSRTSPAKAVMLDALGTERIEALCDKFCCDLAELKLKEGLFLKPRVSAGYGDIPLQLQAQLFELLDCPRQIGLTLNQSMLMSPSKSVTAIVGITEKCCK